MKLQAKHIGPLLAFVAFLIMFGLTVKDVFGVVQFEIPYATETIINFPLYDSNDPHVLYVALPATADCNLFRDQGNSESFDNAVLDDGPFMSWTISAAEATCKILTATIRDASGPALFMDQTIICTTTNHASAFMPKRFANITHVADDAVTDNGDGMLEVNVEKIDDDDASPPNLEILFDATDFASWYNSTDDLIRTDVNQVHGTDVPVTTATLISDGSAAPTNFSSLNIDATGHVDVNLDGVTGTLDAAEIGADAITAAKIADAAITNDQLDTNGSEFTEAGGTGDQFTAIVWNAAWDAEVESEVDDSIGGGTGTALTAVPWNANWDAEVESEVDDALVVQELDHLVHVAESDDPADNSIMAKIAASDGDWSGFSGGDDSLSAIGSELNNIHTDTAAMDTEAEWADLGSTLVDNIQAAIDANGLMQYWTQARAAMIDNLNGFDANHIDQDISAVTATFDFTDANWTDLVGYVDDLETRLSAARAAMIDNLNGLDANYIDAAISAGSVPGAITGTVATAGTTMSFTLSTDFKAGLHAHRGQFITITDADTSIAETRRIKTYSAARVATVDGKDKFSFTPANADVAVVWGFQQAKTSGP